MTALRSLRVALLLGAWALVASCASVPSKPVADIRAIEMTPDFGGWDVYVTPLT